MKKKKRKDINCQAQWGWAENLGCLFDSQSLAEMKSCSRTMIQINRSAEKENDQVSALAQKSPELILREMHKWGLRNAVHREIKKCND